MTSNERALRGLAWALTFALCGVALLACQGQVDPPPNLERAVADFVGSSQGNDGGRYFTPSSSALADLSLAVLAVGDGQDDEAARLSERHAYVLRTVRGGTALTPVKVPDERGWGLYVVRRGGRPVVVEVPHPGADLGTEHLGAELAGKATAAYLLVAGARRDKGNGAADVAHQPTSLFSAVHTALAQRRLPTVQVHGFARNSSPGNDVVISPGSAPLSRLTEAVADALQGAGFKTCRAWRQDCGELEGRTNVQAAASTSAGADFVHLEVTRAVRADSARRSALVAAVVAALQASIPIVGNS